MDFKMVMLKEIIKDHNISVTFTHLHLSNATKNWNHPHDVWKVVVKYNDRNEIFDYKTGIGCRKSNYLLRTNAVKKMERNINTCRAGYYLPEIPSAEDFISCLLLDSEASEISFSEWCPNFG